MTRPDGRAADELRPVTITRNWLDHAAGSVLVEFGRTRVLCAAQRIDGRAALAQGQSGLGWVTAEYAMLPSSTNTRSDRESVKGRIGGRTHEISRLIGRSLRAVIDYKALGENTISSTATCCRPTAAPGRLRSPARTSRWPTPCAHLRDQGALGRGPTDRARWPRSRSASSTASRGWTCPYEEDVRADTDMNVVMTGDGRSSRSREPPRAQPFDRDAARRPARPRRQGMRRPHPDAAAGAGRDAAASSSPPATRRSSRSSAHPRPSRSPASRWSGSTTSSRTPSRPRPSRPSKATR